MPAMKVIRSHLFAGRNVQPGDRIEASEKEARTLRALKWAEDWSELETERPRRQYRRRDMAVEQ